MTGNTAKTGTRLIDEELAQKLDVVLTGAYMDGISVQSNAARTYADAVAAAASMGLLTTETAEGTYGRIWRPTGAGYLWIRELRESQW